jgi:GNAT superfamily N-acetyltransferase
MVRTATASDEAEIIKVLHEMHAEGGLLNLDVDSARNMFAFAFEKRGGIIGVIGNPIEAAIGLLITRFWYTKENHLEEFFSFVRQPYRNTNHAKTLISFAKKCSDEIGIPLVIGVLTNKRIEGKVRLYRRSLGYPAGAFFVYNANWISERDENEDFWKKPFPAHSESKHAKNGRSNPKTVEAAIKL